jgi:hypothetical protein
MTPHDELKRLAEKLRRVVDTGRRTLGGTIISGNGEVSKIWGSEPIMALANPNGPEAADTILALSAENEKLREALVEIIDATKYVDGYAKDANNIARSALAGSAQTQGDGE